MVGARHERVHPLLGAVDDPVDVPLAGLLLRALHRVDGGNVREVRVDFAGELTILRRCVPDGGSTRQTVLFVESVSDFRQDQRVHGMHALDTVPESAHHVLDQLNASLCGQMQIVVRPDVHALGVHQEFVQLVAFQGIQDPAHVGGRLVRLLDAVHEHGHRRNEFLDRLLVTQVLRVFPREFQHSLRHHGGSTHGHKRAHEVGTGHHQIGGPAGGARALAARAGHHGLVERVGGSASRLSGEGLELETGRHAKTAVVVVCHRVKGCAQRVAARSEHSVPHGQSRVPNGLYHRR